MLSIDLGLLAVLTLAGLFAVFRLADSERERDIEAWQVQLGLVAESRGAAVANWLAQHRMAVTGLAENTSVRLYATELAVSGVATAAEVQSQYLFSLLALTADRAGFRNPVNRAEIPANVPQQGRAGLAILGGQGEIWVATPGLPALQAVLPHLDAKQVTVRGDLLLDGEPALAIAAPVFGVQSDPATDDAIGWVIGIKTLDAGLFEALRQPGEVNKSADNYLVQPRGDGVQHLTPLSSAADNIPADTLALDAAALYAVKNPGAMATRKDYAGREVLVTGRKAVDDVGWIVVRTVATGEALGEIDTRRNTLLIILGLAVLSVAAVILMIWRHSASVRATAVAEEQAAAARRMADLSGFLKIVTDSQPTAISAIGADGRLTFANRKAGEEAGANPENLIGKPLEGVFGPVRAKILEPGNREAFGGRAYTQTYRLTADGKERSIKTDHIPLTRDAAQDESHVISSILLVEEDITALVEVRKKRERTLRGLVKTLAQLIDARDPYSAHHSMRVADAAECVAREMKLSDNETETVEIAATLMNLGKIAIPIDLLTRPGSLSADEKSQVREHIAESASLVESLEFDGPVAATLRQAQEHWDGSGVPQGLKGEDILVTARILAVANAFVAMTSARAHRKSMSLDDAGAALLQDAGKIYDRGPVMALLNYIENEGGRARWSGWGKPAPNNRR